MKRFIHFYHNIILFKFQHIILYKNIHEGVNIIILVINNSVAILLKSKDDYSCCDKFEDYKSIFSEINTNLKNKKETFQSYFLNNVPNEILTYYDEKSLYIPIDQGDKDKEQDNKVFKNCFIYYVDFKEKMNELIGRANKNYDSFIKALEINKIIECNKINVCKFYQILKGYRSICTTKLIILGEFAKQWYKNFENENKTQWKDIYNGTLSFELPITLLPIKQVKMGNNHILLLTIEGEVFAMGDGTKGATGDKIRNFHCNPTKIEFPFPNTIIEKIAAGSRHSLALDNTNTLYSWGCGACGCLGVDSINDSFEPKTVEFSTSGDLIAEIDAADNYSACLTNDGNLYTWGNSQFGRLGLVDVGNTKVPQKVKLQLNGVITHIKCGYMTTLIQTSKNNLVAFGIQSLSNIYIEEKKRDDKDSTRDKESEPIVEAPKNKLYSFRVSFKKNKSQKILGMFVGNRFYGFIALNSVKETPTAEGNSSECLNFYFGGDYTGGYNDININLEPMLDGCEEEIAQEILSGYVPEGYQEFKKDKKLSGKKEIKKILCSQNNTAILTHNGDVYVFGSYMYQIAQLDNPYSILQPRGTKVAHLALGANHILMVTTSKEVFAAGRNLEGQLGLGFSSKKVDISAAKQLETFIHQGAKKCYAAENYSVVITMGAKSKVWVFGDIPFLQSSSHLNKQLTPKEMNWGEVDKIACGSTHMLLLVKGSDNLYTIMSVGNGLYGKLGDSNPTGKNHYTPVSVDLPYCEIKYTKEVKLRCGKYTSGVLILESDQNGKRYKLFMWGLCHHKLFVNVKEVEKKHTFGDELPIEGTIAVIKPTLITTYNVQDMAIGEGLCYFILSGKNELEKIGEFIGRRNKGKIIIADQFKKVSLGLYHAAALSKTGKLYTWGSNIMNKLGLNVNEEKNSNILLTSIDNKKEIDLDKYFVDVPSNVVKFNEIFEEQDKNQKDEEINKYLQMNKEEEEETTTGQPQEDDIIDPNEEETEGNTKEKEKDEEEDSQDEGNQSESVFGKAREIIRSSVPKFDALESKLQTNEILLQKKLKETLVHYNILVEKAKNAKLCYRSLRTMFYFKFVDKPLSIHFKNSDKNWAKYPPQFIKHRKAYKALLSMLHTHPCYILNMYKNDLFEDAELYKIIKQLFKGMRHDRFTQLILITLCKEILAIDLKKKNITSLDQYKLIISFENNKEELTLFGGLCKLLFKMDCSFTNRQEIAALYIIGSIFSSMENPFESEEDMEIKINPEDASKRGKLKFNNYQRNSRIGKIMNQFDYFNSDLMEKSSLDKNNLFSLSNVGNYKPLFKLPEICLLLIQEIRSVLKTITPDDEKILDWLSKSFPIIMFSHLLKVLENPAKNLSIDASLLIDRGNYKTFMEKSKQNFYSVSYVFRFCLHYLSLSDLQTGPDDEINKQIEKVFKNSVSGVIINIKNIILNKQNELMPTALPDQESLGNQSSALNQNNKRFDLEYLKEFFNHSLNDSNYVINFSLYSLRRLLEVMIPNRAKIRVLNESYDVMEQIFKETGLLEDGGLINSDIGLDNDVSCQFKLKTKFLCYKTPLTLMKCRFCKSILLNDFILGNEIMFFDQFEFINQSSAKGKFISLLKDLDSVEVKGDKFTLFLKTQYEKKKEQYTFRENLNQLFSLMAVDFKEELIITEEIISDPVKLTETMFSENLPNTILKKYSEDIINCYEKMKEQIKYHQVLFDSLNKIEESIKEKIEEKGHFMVDIYNKISIAIQHGYGNEEIKSMMNNLKISCIFSKMLRHNDGLPKSEIIQGKLSESLKRDLEPIEIFEFKKLIENGIVKNIYQYKDQINKDPGAFKLLILKNKHFEFVVTLIQDTKMKKSFFACGSKDKESKTDNSKKLLILNLTNDILAKLIKCATKAPRADGSVYTVNLGGFIDVEPESFLEILKRVCNKGNY